MASIRNVRKRVRKTLLTLVQSGHGDTKTLLSAARGILGNDVGMEKVFEVFYSNEVSKAMSVLRAEGHVESVGRDWKLATELDSVDVDTVSMRRLKRLRGELNAETKLAHNHGRVEEAVMASKMLEILSPAIKEPVAEVAEVIDSVAGLPV